MPRLMDMMREVRGSTSRFTERKFIAMLRQPLLSSGSLIYVAPNQLRKETLAPAPSRMIVAGDRLIVTQPDGTSRELSLSRYPEIGGLVESVRATLAGDGAMLTRYYAVTLAGNVNDWSLLLQPRDDRLRKLLTTIHIRGQSNMIRFIETVERDGDRTEMAITPDPG